MFSQTPYARIIALRDEPNAVKRGYAFEQLLREILPWDERPPHSVSSKTEQLDAFFEWNSWHFLVEAKAKVAPIRAGTRDWEDFALKMRNRPGQCIGLFCSLFKVTDGVRTEASLLNRIGCTTIVIDEDCWKQLQDLKLPIESFLRFMVAHAKANQSAVPPAFSKIQAWVNDQTAAVRAISTLCQRVSSIFLRRHKLARHDQIYLPRHIDRSISEFADLLSPKHLSNLKKKHVHGSAGISVERAPPKQICIVRDLSGAGKTTLAVQIASQREAFFGATRAALQPDVDDIVDALQLVGERTILQQIVAAERPVLYAVDSLDEALAVPGKHREVRALLKSLDQLNGQAREAGLLCYPFGLVFTVREDFWREWESMFEGTSAHTYIKRFSFFSPEETILALKRYCDAYSFHLSSSLDRDSMRVLSHPFNMQIFAEANEHRGEIDMRRVLDQNVLSLYFERKKEDVLKRPIPGFAPESLMVLLGRIAITVAGKRLNRVSGQELAAAIVDSGVVRNEATGEILRSIVSEQIVVRDSEDSSSFRFRHVRFIEYLVAFFISSKLDQTRDPDQLELMIRQYVRGDFLSLYYVHEFISHICQNSFSDTYASLTSYYSQSETYVRKLVTMRRMDIAWGEASTTLDIDVIKRAAGFVSDEVNWEAFFVIAAKVNLQDTAAVVQAFHLAWAKNSTRADRWKSLTKLGQHGLLLDGAVLEHLLTSERPKEWLVFIAEVIKFGCVADFGRMWTEMGGDQVLQTLCTEHDPDWLRVAKHVRAMSRGDVVGLGELL